jgi:hypothetical protein
MTDAHSNCWLVPLRGHEFDLEDLPIYLHGGRTQVVKRKDAYYLVLPLEDVEANYEPVRNMAVETVARLNGAMTLLVDDHRPIEVAEAAYCALDDSGQIAFTVNPLDTAGVRDKAGHLIVTIDGVPQADSRSGQAATMLVAATRKPPLADALALLGKASPSWAELYLVFELVQSNVGGKMFESGWISTADETRFSRTVNSYTALGRFGRHGKDRGDPPASVMTHRQAINVLRTLVFGWAQSVASETESMTNEQPE